MRRARLSFWTLLLVSFVATLSPTIAASPLEDCAALAARHPGSQVMQVSGNSMRKYFRDGSVLLVVPCEVERIRPGQIVAYRNNDGEVVVHTVTRMGDSVATEFRVRGSENPREDTSAVTRNTLVGVVYAVFNAWTSTRNANNDEKTSGVLIALASEKMN